MLFTEAVRTLLNRMYREDPAAARRAVAFLDAIERNPAAHTAARRRGYYGTTSACREFAVVFDFDAEAGGMVAVRLTWHRPAN